MLYAALQLRSFFFYKRYFTVPKGDSFSKIHLDPESFFFRGALRKQKCLVTGHFNIGLPFFEIGKRV